MQESVYEIGNVQKELKINVEELEIILNSNIEEVISLCKKACLKPKTDTQGNAYFTKSDVDVLKKIKELYKQTQDMKEVQAQSIQSKVEAQTQAQVQAQDLQNPVRKINFLEKAKMRTKQEAIFPLSENTSIVTHLANQMEKFESSIVSKMSAVLSEKMDGFDEIIVELIRSKTENENLRQQINNLNKQVYIMKKELASYKPIWLGLYAKKDSED